MHKAQEAQWSRFIRKTTAEVLLDVAWGRSKAHGWGQSLIQRLLDNAVEMKLLTETEAKIILRRIPEDALGEDIKP